MPSKFLNVLIIVTFACSLVTPIPKAYADSLLGLPEPGTMVNLSPAYEPMLIKGLKVHPENPFLFDFIIDTGSDHSVIVSEANQSLKEQSERLIKYFLAAVTVPEKDLWVNLSPYERNRMIAPNLAQTEMGRDMLAQDYILKQLTASLIYPEKNLGKTFWENVYAKARLLYGTTQIPVNTFNKVWIVADRADVYEHDNTAYVVGAHLKVMLEEDYLALQKHSVTSSLDIRNDTHSIGATIIREIILPQIEKEVNSGRNFALLRQMFYSMILASWYKMALKDAILTQIYGNQSKVKVGINQADPQINQEIFNRYLRAYKKGVFNYIKEDFDNSSGETIPRKYFSGGEDLAMLGHIVHQVSSFDPSQLPDSALLMATVNTFPSQVNSVLRSANGLTSRMPLSGMRTPLTGKKTPIPRRDISLSGEGMVARAEVKKLFPKMKPISGEHPLDVRVKGISGKKLGPFLEWFLSGKNRESVSETLIREVLEEFIGRTSTARLFDEWLLSLRKIGDLNYKCVVRVVGNGTKKIRISYIVDVPVIDNERKKAMARMINNPSTLAVAVPEQLIRSTRKGNVKIVHHGRAYELSNNAQELLDDAPSESLKGKIKGKEKVQIKTGVFINISWKSNGRKYYLLEVSPVEGIIKPFGGAIQFKDDRTIIKERKDQAMSVTTVEFRGVYQKHLKTFQRLNGYNFLSMLYALYVLKIYSNHDTLFSSNYLEPKEKENMAALLAEKLPKNRIKKIEISKQERSKIERDILWHSKNGGIDFDAGKMHMNIQKNDPGEEIHFDQTMINRIKARGFDGLEFHIQSIVPVTNLPLLLGLVSPHHQVC